MNDFILDYIHRFMDPRAMELYIYFKKHIDKNDPAHQMDHINSVARTAIDIGNANGLMLEKWWNLFIMAALGHDHTCYIDRDKHHLEGASRTSMILVQNGYSIEDASLVSCMIAQHRASFKGTYTNIFAEVFAAADRGAPDLDQWIKRSVQYWIGQGHSAEEGCQHALMHMPEKFGRNGYGKFPSVWSNYYKGELAKIHDKIDVLTIDDVMTAYVG